MTILEQLRRKLHGVELTAGFAGSFGKPGELGGGSTARWRLARAADAFRATVPKRENEVEGPAG